MEDAFTENILTAPSEEVVCYCAGVIKGQILQAMREGARSLQDVKATTGACTVERCKELNPRRR
ncbi:(2Fe-2S)-binding protein [Desulforhabdus sp. TSK]|uniref:(2Fe-2S)-binding protein n=1 Tax=Desulforhabdus sp. TSK TaxID=2925014 RepID=UPI00208D793A|nr:(2Fe-2S)-binding protein [Desulforhabdus sp. TSK]GKT07802.1 hypothetical protein DSTSK_11070 [Desulforhabdus sp. TSK]